MTEDKRIWEISQTIIAVLVVGAGLIAMLTNNPSTNSIVPLSTLVLGYYFGRATPTPGAEIVGIIAASKALPEDPKDSLKK